MPIYNPKEVVIIFGDYTLLDFAVGTSIIIESNAEPFSEQIGADGSIVRTVNADNTHRVILTLIRSSPSNEVLTDASKKSEIKTLKIVGTDGATKFRWSQAWINGHSIGLDECKWVFDTGQAENIDASA
jgi:hypothetical protein